MDADRRTLLAGLIGPGAAVLGPGAATARNPAIPGWYADPEIRIFGGRYWIYPTTSSDGSGPAPAELFTPAQMAQRRTPGIWAPFLRQTFLDAFSSPDLVTWTRHPRILDVKHVAWAAYALWAPSAIEHRGRYYLFFGANDLKHDGETGGIGVAVSERPDGPFRDAIGAPLIGRIVHGAQPIDQMAFRDDDGRIYLYYGGWKHCNVVELGADLRTLHPITDPARFRPITPSPGYVEGPFMLKRRGTYYLMWSEGEWTGPDYKVAYATGPSPIGPFAARGTILERDGRVARGAGHNSVINVPGTDDWYIVYHRRPLGDQDGNHRQIAIDRMRFATDGRILPVRISHGGIAPRALAAG
jgi:hypothetical protein